MYEILTRTTTRHPSAHLCVSVSPERIEDRLDVPDIVYPGTLLPGLTKGHRALGRHRKSGLGLRSRSPANMRTITIFSSLF